MFPIEHASENIPHACQLWISPQLAAVQHSLEKTKDFPACSVTHVSQGLSGLCRGPCTAVVPTTCFPTQVGSPRPRVHVMSLKSFFSLHYYLLCVWALFKTSNPERRRGSSPSCPFVRCITNFPLFFCRCFVIKFTIIWFKVISSAAHTSINWLKKKTTVNRLIGSEVDKDISRRPAVPNKHETNNDQ